MEVEVIVEWRFVTLDSAAEEAVVAAGSKQLQAEVMRAASELQLSNHVGMGTAEVV
jgi:hypothetical protein